MSDTNSNSSTNTKKLIEYMKEFERKGYITLPDGRRVEIDHPDSPVRKAGLI